MTEKIAAVMGALAFIFAVIFGLVYGISEEKVLLRAVISLVIFFVLAMIVGHVGHMIVNEKLKAKAILRGELKGLELSELEGGEKEAREPAPEEEVPEEG